MIGKAMAEAGGGVYEMAHDFSGYDDIPGNKRTKERVEVLILCILSFKFTWLSLD